MVRNFLKSLENISYKKVLVAIIGLTSLVSCNSLDIPENDVIYTDISIHKSTELCIIKYEFEGHKYQFHVFHLGSLNGVGGLVHDPDCSCFRNDSLKVLNEI